MLNRKNSFSKAFKIATTRTKYSLKGEDEVGKKIQKAIPHPKNAERGENRVRFFRNFARSFRRESLHGTLRPGMNKVHQNSAR